MQTPPCAVHAGIGSTTHWNAFLFVTDWLSMHLKIFGMLDKLRKTFIQAVLIGRQNSKITWLKLSSIPKLQFCRLSQPRINLSFSTAALGEDIICAILFGMVQVETFSNIAIATSICLSELIGFMTFSVIMQMHHVNNPVHTQNTLNLAIQWVLLLQTPDNNPINFSMLKMLQGPLSMAGVFASFWYFKWDPQAFC